MALAYLGFGTNLGDREANLGAGLAALATLGEIEAVSSIYQSEPVGFRDQPDFLNLAVRFRTDLGPEELLTELEAIESRLGRRRSFRNAPRVLDIDILLYDDLEYSTTRLVIPHPRLLERAFVLRPLVELDPDLRLPGSGIVLSDHLLEAEGLERAEPIGPGDQLLSR